VEPPDHLHLVVPPHGLLIHHEPTHQDVVRQGLAQEYPPRGVLSAAAAARARRPFPSGGGREGMGPGTQK
jgi:hypothetical protein